MKACKITQADEFGCVAVLMGGVSSERQISIAGGMAVYNALKRQQINVLAIDVKDRLIEQLDGQKITRVFNMIHGYGGEDGRLQGVLEAMNIPYTGSGVMASALTMDKLRTKLCWQGYGLPTPKWFEVTCKKEVVSCIEPCVAYLGLPMIIKPVLEGSSMGMSKADNRQQLSEALTTALTFKGSVYAEQWVQGAEYTITVLDDKALPVIRLQTPHPFYDFEAKYEVDSTSYHCPCGLSVQQENAIKGLAIEACSVVGVSGWARVDLLIDEANNPQLIEVNTVPGMTDHSLVPMTAKAAGIGFDELVWRILETSMNA